ncbi:MAG: Fe-S cluster assembly protein HesB [Bacteroidetes bacterium]|nr:Fe-S cluster assembly protein HesB [Bacteroidota bacterium]
MQRHAVGNAGTFLVPTPRDFDFWRTAYSHGWCDLLPFSFDPEARGLTRVLELRDGSLVGCALRNTSRGVRVTCTGPSSLTPDQRKEIRLQIRTCLRLDEDFTPFHAAMRKVPAYRWMARHRAGRLLRAPTLFEDTVKMICTTNCAWHLTVVMVRAMVQKFGCHQHGMSGFPTPSVIAASSEQELRKECSTGYRAPALLDLAERVASGSLPLEEWRHSGLTTRELYEALCGIRGVGPYAAGNLLKLIGRYEYLGLDSWVRKRWAELHARGRAVKDRRIERHYEPFGAWRGLVFWLEMTQDWHDGAKGL